jgi:hypothetical protein
MVWLDVQYLQQLCLGGRGIARLVACPSEFKPSLDSIWSELDDMCASHPGGGPAGQSFLDMGQGLPNLDGRRLEDAQIYIRIRCRLELTVLQ